MAILLILRCSFQQCQWVFLTKLTYINIFNYRDKLNETSFDCYDLLFPIVNFQLPSSYSLFTVLVTPFFLACSLYQADDDFFYCYARNQNEVTVNGSVIASGSAMQIIRSDVNHAINTVPDRTFTARVLGMLGSFALRWSINPMIVKEEQCKNMSTS